MDTSKSYLMFCIVQGVQPLSCMVKYTDACSRVMVGNSLNVRKRPTKTCMQHEFSLQVNVCVCIPLLPSQEYHITKQDQ